SSRRRTSVLALFSLTDPPPPPPFSLSLHAALPISSGEPILLMADHQTAGGYPVVAGVARCDLPLAAQLLPGEHLRFRLETVAAAQAEWRRQPAALDTLR